MKLLRSVGLAILMAMTVAAQTADPVAQARQLATAGHRAEAIHVLEQQLASHPDDIDARTLLGIVLSWDHQYDRARRELQLVLMRDPNNADARQALDRIEVWSRATKAAPQPEVMIGGNYDDYLGSDAWREAFALVKLDNRVAPLVLRGAHAKRFGLNDSQFDAELYPKFGPRTYAYLAAGFSPNADLYPRSRFGAELFHGFAAGWEASAGARRLNFADAVNVYTASLSKYAGNWLFTARGYDARASKAGFLMARYYFGAAGQYVGLRAGRGSTRDDIRSASDLASLSFDELAGETRLLFGRRWLVEARAGVASSSRKSASLAFGARF